jgi:hypothetical protein
MVSACTPENNLQSIQSLGEIIDRRVTPGTLLAIQAVLQIDAIAHEPGLDTPLVPESRI